MDLCGAFSTCPFTTTKAVGHAAYEEDVAEIMAQIPTSPDPILLILDIAAMLGVNWQFCHKKPVD